MHLLSWRGVVLIILIGLMVNWYLDSPLPDDMQEKWKVRFIDAGMRTYGNLQRLLVSIGIIEPFSPLDRWLVDKFVITMTTGRPWVQKEDKALEISDLFTTGNKIQMRMYEPKTTLHQNRRPVFFYFHGGGFSLMSIESYDAVTRKLARDSGVVVISVNYRLSPQHPYPTPLVDCLEAIDYVVTKSQELRIDPDRIAVGGDSAGGNLAASVSLRLKKKIKLQFLLVPVFQMFTYNTTSVISNRKYFSKTVNNLFQVVFWTNYIGCGSEYILDMISNRHTSSELKKSNYATYVDEEKWLNRKHIDEELKNKDLTQKTDFGFQETPACLKAKMLDPYICPLMARKDMLENLPRAYVMTAGYDLIRDDGIMYAERLKNAGISTDLVNHKSSFHNALTFVEGPLTLGIAKQTIQDIVNYVQLHL
ncbi:neutral cholesterol ester hydrolase 1-like [Mercenaria mercenaria]|uniref:neutral cholesterol ester hydrolase 1-like n=1 Tax=Mercenaria mercenaria TaxID=6596 RepID=UPI00234EDCA1|nr:neutral cholesterol ester hydrolase 1-like [Mercenaria mercenaria]